MEFKSIQEIEEANLSRWEKDAMIKLFEEEENLKNNCKMILEHFEQMRE